MPEFNIGRLKTEMGGVAKPFLFSVNFGPTPTLLSRVFGGASQNEFSSFMVRSTTIPSKTVGAIEIPYFGVDLKLAGNPAFEPWTCTFMVDEAYKIRNILERWGNEVFSISNLGKQTFASPADYFGNVFIDQLNDSGEVLARYTLHFAWPSEIGAITLSHDEKDSLETFDCTFTYSFWTRPESQLKL